MQSKDWIIYIKESASLARYAIETGREKYALCKLWDIEQVAKRLLGEETTDDCPSCEKLHPSSNMISQET